MDDIITRLRHLADYITAASGYTYIEKPMKSGWDEIMRKAATAIEELAAQVKDKDYLIQQQTEEIQRLQRDVKKQQEKMIELAKKLPKRGEWIRVGDRTWKCSVCGEISCCDANYCPDCGAKMEVQDG